jgi:hypothetical protein
MELSIWYDECCAEAEVMTQAPVLVLVAQVKAPDERHDKEEVEVEFVKHTKWRAGAPTGSNTRDLYRFTGGGAHVEKDCWFWWRDIDGIVRILGGGGSRRPKQPTIYYFKIKGAKLSCCIDKDQSEAWEIYNQYGNK